jgi:hypothetical protein
MVLMIIFKDSSTGVVSAADTPDKKEHLVLVETGR